MIMRRNKVAVSRARPEAREARGRAADPLALRSLCARSLPVNCRQAAQTLLEVGVQSADAAHAAAAHAAAAKATSTH